MMDAARPVADIAAGKERQVALAGSLARVAIYAATAAASLLLLALVLRLWRADLSVPFAYTGDSLLTQSWIKGIIENGWYLHNGLLGAPGELSLLDFPMADNLHFLVIKGITLFTADDSLAVNLFFLLGFPLTAISSLFVFRRLRISWPVAAAGSLLFTFTPYHLLRGEVHLLLSAIFVIPLTSFAVLRVAVGPPPFLKRTGEGKEVFDLTSLRTVGFLLVAVLTGSAGIYYAGFGCFFLLMTGTYAAIRSRSLRQLASAGIMIALIAAVMFLNLLPSVIHEIGSGRNEQVARRNPVEAEIFGGTITQMLLPVPGHRIEAVRAVTDRFTRSAVSQGTTVLVNENQWSSLGLIGSFGLVFLLGWLLFARRPSAGGAGAPGERVPAGEGMAERLLDRSREKQGIAGHLLDPLSILSGSGVLLGTIGGFGLLIALTLSSQLRAYNRISIYLAFFSILCVLALLEWIRRRYVSSPARRLVFIGGLALLLTGGIFDQTSNAMVPSYGDLDPLNARDDAFFRQVEEKLPPGAMVFQLPYVRFPESTPVYGITGYDHLRAYLHTKTLRWSFGAMAGSGEDSWQQEVSGEPAAQMLAGLKAAGFAGVYVNRDGYADGAQELAGQFERLLGKAPVTSVDGRLLYFDLTGGRPELR